MSTASQTTDRHTEPFDQTVGDSLDDFLGDRGTTVRALITPPETYKAKDFSEPCPKCRGTGRFTSYSGRALGQCFTCKGAGKKLFKTSRADRDSARASREASVARKAASAIDDFKVGYPEIWAWMDGNTFGFAVAMRDALAKYGFLTDRQMAACESAMVKLAAAKAASAERIASAPVADAAGVDRLKEAFDKAKAYSAAKGKGIHLRNPKITIGGMTISPAKATSANAGALYVKSGEQYLGKVVGGKFFASRECSADQAAKVLAFVADPGAAAKAYGKETGVCCVCNAALTSEWRLQGIGPICSTKFGW